MLISLEIWQSLLLLNKDFMNNSVYTETISLDLKYCISSEKIESFLNKKYSNVLRWAIIEVKGNNAIISVSYKA